MASKLHLDEALVRRLADLMTETGLTEIEIEEDDRRLRVARKAEMTASVPFAAQPAPAPAVTADSDGKAQEGLVRSPMVGTVYLAPEPGRPAFVKVGDSVQEGQTLVIIEAMKVMNSLPSPQSGQVQKILVQDGQPVEYGEPLMVVA